SGSVNRPGEAYGREGAREAAAKKASAPDPLSAPAPLEADLSPAEDRIVAAEWSRRIPPIMARVPQVRIGRRWYSILWLVPIGVVLLIVGIGVWQHVRTHSAGPQRVGHPPRARGLPPPGTTA